MIGGPRLVERREGAGGYQRELGRPKGEGKGMARGPEGDGPGRPDSRKRGNSLFFFKSIFKCICKLNFETNLFCINSHITKIKCCNMNASTCFYSYDEF